MFVKVARVLCFLFLTLHSYDNASWTNFTGQFQKNRGMFCWFKICSSKEVKMRNKLKAQCLM